MPESVFHERLNSFEASCCLGFGACRPKPDTINPKLRLQSLKGEQDGASQAVWIELPIGLSILGNEVVGGFRV